MLSIHGTLHEEVFLEIPQGHKKNEGFIPLSICPLKIIMKLIWLLITILVLGVSNITPSILLFECVSETVSSETSTIMLRKFIKLFMILINF